MNNLIIKTLFGSHLYGLNTENSDKDYKSVFIPPIQDLVLENVKHTINTSSNPGDKKNTSQDIDMEIFSIHKYLTLLLQGQAVALDMFFTPKEFILESTEEWKYIRSLKSHWLHKNISPYVGYARKQAAKYGIKGSRVSDCRRIMEFFASCVSSATLEDYWYKLESLAEELEHCEIVFEETRSNEKQLMFVCCGKKYQRNLKIKYAQEYSAKHFKQYGNRALQAENNENIDWKAVSHAVRIAEEAIELLSTHNIEFPLKNKDFILQIKKGELDYSYVADIISEKFVELEEAQVASTLPQSPDWEKRKEVLLDIYS